MYDQVDPRWIDDKDKQLAALRERAETLNHEVKAFMVLHDGCVKERDRLRKYLNVYVRALWPTEIEIPEGTFTREEIAEIAGTLALFDQGRA